MKSSGFRHRIRPVVKMGLDKLTAESLQFSRVMNKSPGTTFLLIVLVISTLLSVLFCVLYTQNARQLRNLQRAAAAAQGYMNVFGALVNDTMEYSRKNPAVEPILEGAGFTPRPAALTGKPPGK